MCGGAFGGRRKAVRDRLANKIRNENGEITTDNTEIEGIIRDYYQQLHANKMDNLEEMDKFLEKHNFPPPPQDPSPLRGTLGSSLRSPAEGEDI